MFERPMGSRGTAAATKAKEHYVVCVEHNERRQWRYNDPGLPLF
jgi:hypothetical protein